MLITGRGAFCLSRILIVRLGGLNRKENVGISNDKAGEKPARRKIKVSWAMLISSGLVGA